MFGSVCQAWELNSDWSCRSGVLGLPKVKRDKFSVFNFLTVEKRETTGRSDFLFQPFPLKPLKSGAEGGIKPFTV